MTRQRRGPFSPNCEAGGCAAAGTQTRAEDAARTPLVGFCGAFFVVFFKKKKVLHWKRLNKSIQSPSQVAF